VIDEGRNENGKRRQRWQGGFKTKREAQTALTEALRKIDMGAYIPPSKLTLGQYLTEEWLISIRTQVRPSTFDSYRRNIELHVLPDLGGVKLQRLGPEHLDRLYDSLLRTGSRRGKEATGLAPKTVRNVHLILAKALHDALKRGKIHRNPASVASPPRLSAARSPERTTWTAEELRRFLSLVEDDRLQAAWVLLATTGMRRGEVLGLRWDDLDLDNARLLIRQALISVGYEAQFSEPKTGRSARVVDLDPVTVGALKAHRAKQAEERLLWGPYWQDHGLVFTRENGTAFHPQLLSDAFDRLVKRSGLPKIRLHDLRHTYATLSLRAGIRAEVVSRRLGHATVAFTQDTYTHAIPAMEQEAAEQVARLIFGEKC
jgi:integrase